MDKIKASVTKKAEYVYMLAFLLGIVAANLIGSEQLEQYGILNSYFIRQLLYASVNYNDLFLYVMENRGAVFILLVVFGITRLGVPVHFVYLAWNGFSFGVAMVSVIANFGIKGILILCAFLFPQYVFYIPLYLLLFLFSCYWKDHYMVRQNRTFQFRGALWLLLLCGIAIGLFVIGIMTESYVNPHIMKKILRNI